MYNKKTLNILTIVISAVLVIRSTEKTVWKAILLFFLYSSRLHSQE